MTQTMKRKLLMVCFLVLMTGSILAEGDKVRGDKGQGGVTQVQVQPPWWVTVVNWLFP